MRYVLAILLLLPAASFALEKDYQREWCDHVGGKMEVVLPDGARVDCVTEKYAIEFDFAKSHWAESIGQALYYGIALHKRPGVVLIVGPKDNVYVERVKAVAKRHGIKVWEMAK